MTEKPIPGVGANAGAGPKGDDIPTVSTEVVVRSDGSLPAPPMMKPGEAVVMMKTIDKYIKDAMVENVDYGVIPGTGNKPTLLKPGAEKLCALFALSATVELVEEIQDHFREWEFEVWNKKEKKYETKKATGWFFYRYRATLTQRGTGTVMATAEGSCSSQERGKERQPANAVMKMAQKRAIVGATLQATWSSGRFTQDMEEMQTGGGGGKKKSASGKAASGKGGDIKARIKSKAPRFGDFNKCAFCGNSHVSEGEEIVGVTTPGKDGLRWGSEECFKQEKLQSEAAAKEQKNDGDATSGGGDIGMEVRCLDLEKELFPDETAENINELRVAYTGKSTLSEASDTGMQNYLDYLEDEKKQQQ